MSAVAGVLLTAAAGTALWGGAILLARRWLQHGSGWDRTFWACAFGWTACLVGLEILSLVGTMSRGPAVAWAGIVLLVGVVVSTRLGRRVASERAGQGARPLEVRSMRAQTHGWQSVGLATAAVVLTLTAGGYQLARGLLLPVEPVSDAPVYHLYFAVRWWQAGRIEMIATPFGELAATYFPANGALWFCWLVTMSGSELLAKVGQWPFWLLSSAVVYALSREVGTTRTAAAWLAALWATGSTVLLQGAGLANVDLIFAAWYMVAVYFLVRYAREWRGFRLQASDDENEPRQNRSRKPDARRSLDGGLPLLSGFALAVGAALGTKATGVFFVPLLVLPAVGLAASQHRRWSHLAVLLVGLVLPSGYWYGRNWVVTGNPVYPAHVEILGVPILEGWYDWSAMRQSGYHIPTDQLGWLLDRWSTVIDVRPGQVGPAIAELVRARWQLEGINPWPFVAVGLIGVAHLALWPIAVATGFVTGLRKRHEEGLSHWRSKTALALTVLSLVYLAVYWWLVPYQSQQRFLFPAVGLVIVPLARLLDRRAALQAVVGLVVLAHLLAPLGTASYDRAMGRVRIAWVPHAIEPRPHPWEVEPRLFYPAWGDFAPTLLPLWEAVESHSPPQGTRIAYTGTNLPYYLFGRGLRNHVEYVNVNPHGDYLMHDYHHQRLATGQRALADDPWPAWYRAEPQYDAWLANLHQRGIELLVVTRENQHGRREPDRIPPIPIEERWAREHPEHFEVLAKAVPPGQSQPWGWLYRVKRAGQSTNPSPDPADRRDQRL